jgi:hypothetical protein
MKRIFILIFAVFIFMACTQSPTPLPPDAVDTAIAQTIAAWTTEAPASTKPPIPTNTALPTLISPGQTDDNALPPDATAYATFATSNTNVIIDVTTILGKPISQVEEITGKTVLITPNDDHDDVLAGGEYRDYEIGKYYVFLSLDEDGIARGFQVMDGLSSENYSLNDWKTLLPRFGLNVTAPPDQEAPAALYWYNFDGYGIGLASNNISGKPVWTVQIEDSNIFRR